MPQVTATFLADEQSVRLLVTARDATAPEAGYRTEFALEVCPSPTCHCRDMTLVETTSTAPQPRRPAEFSLDPFAHTVVAAATGPAAGQLPDQAIADAISTGDWQQLRSAFLAAKARVFAAADWSLEQAQFPFADVEQRGQLVPLREVIPFAPALELPAAGDRQFTIDEQYCVLPGCDCTESVIGVSSYSSEDAGPRMAAEPVVDFRVDWVRNRWRVAAGSRQLTPVEEDLRSRLLAANPDLLAELSRRHEIMRELYEVSEAAASRAERRSVPVRAPRHIGRNEPCPCGSGKKYKRCCLPGEAAAPG